MNVTTIFMERRETVFTSSVDHYFNGLVYLNINPKDNEMQMQGWSLT